MTELPPEPREVTLTLAPDEALLRVVRLTASSLAADIDFQVREIDDLVLAVDELTAALFAVAGDTVSIRLRADNRGVRVSGHSADGGDIELGELATSILDQACDLYEISGNGTGPSFSMVKLRAGIG